MNANLRKEIRIVLPVVVAGILVMLTAGLVSLGCLAFTGNGCGELMMSIANGSFILGCLFVGVRPFCAEFQHGTIGLMLVQPVSRWEQWGTKHQVQLYSLISLSAAFVVAALAIVWEPWNEVSALKILGWLDHTEVLSLLVVPVLAYLTCPLWAMLLRSTVGAGVVAVTCPFAVSLPFLIWAAVTEKEPAPWICILTALTYLLLCCHFGKRCFFRLQVTGGGMGEIDLVERILRVIGPVQGARPERLHQSSAWALFKKELCLQQAPVLLCLLMLLGFLVMRLLDLIYLPAGAAVVRAEDYLGGYVAILGFYVFLVPLVSGCIAMTEERASGIHSWQITLPPSRNRQWLIKMAGLICTNIILVVLIPGLLLLLFPALREYVLKLGENDDGPLQFIAGFIGMNAGLMIVSLYVASLCRHTAHAVLAALGAIVYLIVVFIAGPFVAHLANPLSAGHFWILLSMVAPAIMAILLLYLSRANFGQAEMSTTKRLCQVAAVCSFLVLLVFALGGIVFGVPDAVFGFVL